MKLACLDLGSNTFLLLICQVENGKIKKLYHDEAQVTRLGQGVNLTGEFHPEALARAEACFDHYSKIIEEHRPDHVMAMATSAARDAKNSEILFSLGEKFGLPIKIIPGEMEARLTFYGAGDFGAEDKSVYVIDVGGGSTEIVGRNSSNEFRGVSVDVGSVRLMEAYLKGDPPTLDEIKKLVEHCEKAFENSLGSVNSCERVVAVAGTPTALACVQENKTFSESFVHGYEFSVEELGRLVEELRQMPLSERLKLPGLSEGRADVIVAGSHILWLAAKRLGSAKLEVSCQGVRYGMARLFEEIVDL